ncbi:MAG TPA: sulfite exporter TauE/SafE family protein, partial [Dehalococcoidia bacterium]|nr:sulfite exporter TauE/SafE family protein [Dehalococcoidia bacterium]
AASGLLVVGVGVWMLLKREHHGNGHLHSRPGIVSLGISGGIVPCPAAITMLLLAISLGRVVEGLLVVVAFSLGLAMALVLLGILATRASDLLMKRWHSGNVSWFVPKVSAIVVIFLGLVLVYRAWSSG